MTSEPESFQLGNWARRLDFTSMDDGSAGHYADKRHHIVGPTSPQSTVRGLLTRNRGQAGVGKSATRDLMPAQRISNGSEAGGGVCSGENRGRPNGPEVNPRGQGPRGYGSAAHGLPACESRDAGRAPPCRF